MRVPVKAQEVLRRPASPLMDDQVAGNNRRATLMVASFAVAVAVVISVLGALLGAGAFGVLLALVVAGALAGAAYLRSDSVVISASRAQPADPVVHARLHNLVEGLCVSLGLPKPAVSVIEDDAPNAFSVGRSPRQATLVVTSGLLEKLNRIELEGVLAHELSHVRNRDILPATLAVTLVGPVARVLPAPAAASLLQNAVGSRRQTLADLSAVSCTRYPPGLISALGKLRDSGTAARYATRANAHLWLAPPFPGDTTRHLDLGATLEQRIAALQEL